MIRLTVDIDADSDHADAFKQLVASVVKNAIHNRKGVKVETEILPDKRDAWKDEERRKAIRRTRDQHGLNSICLSEKIIELIDGRKIGIATAICLADHVSIHEQDKHIDKAVALNGPDFRKYILSLKENNGGKEVQSKS